MEVFSFQLLPGSLRKLALSFGAESKTWLPYEFVKNSDLDLNFVGLIPNI